MHLVQVGSLSGVFHRLPKKKLVKFSLFKGTFSVVVIISGQRCIVPLERFNTPLIGICLHRLLLLYRPFLAKKKSRAKKEQIIRNDEVIEG